MYKKSNTQNTFYDAISNLFYMSQDDTESKNISLKQFKSNVQIVGLSQRNHILCAQNMMTLIDSKN